MGEKTNIAWTDVTWNIARGCTKVDDDCRFCYMYRESLNSTRYNPLQVTKTKTVFNLPLKLTEPSKIFTSSLTDFFHEDCDPFRKEAWEIIRKCPQHTFQILTKRPERIDRNFYIEKTETGGIIYQNMKNVWIGTSVGHMDGMHRMKSLVNSRWKGLKFLSLEPLHGPIDFESTAEACVCDKCGGLVFDHGIDWVIVGGESGNENGKYRYRPCELSWIESIIQFCKESQVPVFVKQLGTHLAKELGLKHRHGGDMDEWPEHLRVRQFPTV